MPVSASKRRKVTSSEPAAPSCELPQSRSYSLSEVLSKKAALRQLSDAEFGEWVREMPAADMRRIVQEYIALKYEPRPVYKGFVAHSDFLQQISNAAVRRRIRYKHRNDCYPHSLRSPQPVDCRILDAIPTAALCVDTGAEANRAKHINELPRALLCECLSFLPFAEMCRRVARVCQLWLALSKEKGAHYYLRLTSQLLQEGVGQGLDLSAFCGFKHVHFCYVNSLRPKTDASDSRSGYALSAKSSLEYRVKTHNFEAILKQVLEHSPRLHTLEFGLNVLRRNEWRKVKVDAISQWYGAQGGGEGFFSRWKHLFETRAHCIRRLVFNGDIFSQLFPSKGMAYTYGIRGTDETITREFLTTDERFAELLSAFPRLEALESGNFDTAMRTWLWLQNNPKSKRKEVMRNGHKWQWPSVEAVVCNASHFAAMFVDSPKCSQSAHSSSRIFSLDTSAFSQLDSSGSSVRLFGSCDALQKAIEVTGDGNNSVIAEGRGRGRGMNRFRMDQFISKIRSEYLKMYPVTVDLSTLQSLRIEFMNKSDKGTLIIADSSALPTGVFQLPAAGDCEQRGDAVTRGRKKKCLSLVVDSKWFGTEDLAQNALWQMSFRRLLKESCASLKELSICATQTSTASLLTQRSFPRRIRAPLWLQPLAVDNSANDDLEPSVLAEDCDTPLLLTAATNASDIVFANLRQLTLTIAVPLLTAATNSRVSLCEVLPFHCGHLGELLTAAKLPKVCALKLVLVFGENFAVNADAFNQTVNPLFSAVAEMLRSLMENGTLQSVEIVLSGRCVAGLCDNELENSEVLNPPLRDLSNFQTYGRRPHYTHILSEDNETHCRLFADGLRIDAATIGQLLNAVLFANESKGHVSVAIISHLKLHFGRFKAAKLTVRDPMRLARGIAEGYAQRTAKRH